MPSLKNDGGELFKYLTQVEKFTKDPAGLATVTTEAITKDIADTDAASITGLSGDEFVGIIGTGGAELAQVDSAATGNIVWEWPLQVPQLVGASITELLKRSMNHIAESGVQFGGTGSINPRRAATARSAIAFTPSPVEGFTFAIPTLGWNSNNLASGFGVPESEEGAGSAADPWAIAITPGNVMTEGILFFRLTGTLDNGNVLVVDLCDCTIEPQVAVTLGVENTEGPVTAGRCTSIVQHIYAP